MGLYNFSPFKGIHNLEIHMKGITCFLRTKECLQRLAHLWSEISHTVSHPGQFKEEPKTRHPKLPHSIQTIAATVAPMTQYPAFSTTMLLVAAPVLAPLLVLLSVPFGNVPLITIVFVPFTTPTCTKLLFSAAILPFPISSPKYVLLSLLSHPHALYC